MKEKHMPKTSNDQVQKGQPPREPRDTKPEDKPGYQFKDWAAL